MNHNHTPDDSVSMFHMAIVAQQEFDLRAGQTVRSYVTLHKFFDAKVKTLEENPDFVGVNIKVDGVAGTVVLEGMTQGQVNAKEQEIEDEPDLDKLLSGDLKPEDMKGLPPGVALLGILAGVLGKSLGNNPPVPSNPLHKGGRWDGLAN